MSRPFEMGEQVFDTEMWQWGAIIGVVYNDQYPVRVKLSDDRKISYTADGRRLLGISTITLLHADEVKEVPPRPKRKIKKSITEYFAIGKHQLSAPEYFVSCGCATEMDAKRKSGQIVDVQSKTFEFEVEE
jgi:hypothetical protein